MSSLLSYAKGIREAVTPVRKTSAYHEKGVLTPEEFVAAGDQLVFKCPTWAWEAGDPSKTKPYLPKDKQYLVTRGVPCQRRVAALETDYLEETEVDGAGGDDADGGWLEPKVMTHHGDGGEEIILELGGEPENADSAAAAHETAEARGALASSLAALQLNDDHFRRADGGGGSGGGAAAQKTAAGAEGGAEGGYPDLDTYVEDNVMEPDAATLAPGGAGGGAGAGGAAAGQAGGSYLVAEEPHDDSIVRTRTYDLSITYDKYYQVPRIWLVGYDESGAPLSHAATFEDIMQDYARQTVTMEPHPHLSGGALVASVHPCRHAAVLKRMVSNLGADGSSGGGGGGSGAARVDQCLFVFLKFIQSVCPTIDYDYTMEVDARG